MRDVFLHGKSVSAEDILQTLSLHGVAVVQDYISEPEVLAAREEFFRLLQQQEGSSDLFLKKNGSRVARLWEKLPQEWCHLGAPLYSGLTRQIAAGFYGPHKYHLNQHVYLTHDVDRMDFNEGWHTDPSRSLKFMMYLNDVTEKNGAMKYIPGSNYHGVYRIHYNRFRGNDEFPVFLADNEVPEGAVSLCGTAGTMIIFDAAGFHSAGSLMENTERLVLRGHCFAARTIRTRICDRIRKSGANWLNYLETEDELVADRFKSKSTANVVKKTSPADMT